jgi:hypothetical protein
MAESENPTGVLTIYVSLAMNQVEFFYALGRRTQARGERAAHICFHEGGCEWLNERGAWVFNPFTCNADPFPFSAYGIDDPIRLVAHERAAYEQLDEEALLRKFASHLGAVRRIFDDIVGRHTGPIRVVQELGGFLSVLSVFYEARRRMIDNYFLEPSFFRRRFFVVKNSLSAFQVAGPIAEVVSPEVLAYVKDTVRKQSLVVPLKDRSHYRGPLRKLFDARNWRRLVEKIADKYLRGRQEEFNHIGGHVLRHIKMYCNHARLRPHYRQIPSHGNFVYYPLHVPADVALTLRSPAYLDQVRLIDEIAQQVPLDWSVVFKEHPALVGAVSAGAIVRMIRGRRNVVILDPQINNFEVLKAAEVVVTVNSKTGAEALMFQKPVVVLGDAFYRSCSLVNPVRELAGLGELIGTGGYRRIIREEDACRYFQDVWQASFPGEIYDLVLENIDQFSESLSLATIGNESSLGPRVA